MKCHKHVCFIVPPHILNHMAETAEKGDKRRNALRTLAVSSRLRGRREAFSQLGFAMLATGVKRRTIYDAKHLTALPGTLVRGEGDGPSKDDIAINEAYDFSGATYDFYKKAFDRNSIDDRGMRLDSSVHYDRDYDNAFFDGRQMVYGDGDREIFDRFTKCIDVVGHELTHGVTAATADLTYEGQSGALNESMSDVFGSLVKQMSKNQTAAQADWLIGEGLLLPAINGKALRSMAAPGTAYNDPGTIGVDPQPADMAHYVETTDDEGGVHINSGIPNRAFYLAATKIGGYAWEKAGKIWYVTLTQRLNSSADFQTAADTTFAVAGELYGSGSAEQTAVEGAWEEVGLKIKHPLKKKAA